MGKNEGNNIDQSRQFARVSTSEEKGPSTLLLLFCCVVVETAFVAADASIEKVKVFHNYSGNFVGKSQ
jgi:hypothetical protein